MSDFSVGLSGILGAKRALETIGQNIANASTPGYARREVKFAAVRSNLGAKLDTGSGVSVETITRVKDMFLEGRVQAYRSSLARAEVQTRYFAEIEGFLQEPSDLGIGGLLDQFFSQWEAAALRPEDVTGRTMILLTGQQLAERICALRQDLTGMRSSLAMEIRDAVEQVNSLTERLAKNNELVDQFTGTTPPLSLQDERDQIMTQLAELVGAVNMTPNDPHARVTVGNMLLVSGSQSMTLAPPEDYDSPITLAAGDASAALTLTGGKVAGLMELNQRVIPEFVARLDNLASALIRAVNALHAQGIAQDGRFTEIIGQYSVKDLDGDGNAANDLLSRAGLPFVPSAGALTIHVADASGNVATHTLQIDPSAQSLAEVAAALDALDNISASVVNGKLRIAADPGCGFDFAADQGSDILAALGVNSFFDGYDASDIRLAANLADRPDRLALGRTTDSGDGSNAAAIAALRTASVAAAGGIAIPEAWRRFVTEVGVASAGASRSAETLGSMVDLLYDQEQAVSGVSLDEEAAKMMQYQEMYSACARYLATIARLTENLIEYL